MATDTESMHDSMTRLRMRMVQQKLANEREKLQRSESRSTDNGYEDQVKLRNAYLRRQELLDKIRQEQLNEGRPKTYSPRRRYTPSPPLSRRSLPDINTRHYHFGLNGGNNQADSTQVRHVIEHQFRSAPPQQGYSQLPPLQAAAQPIAVPQVTAVPQVHALQPIIAQPMTPAEIVPLVQPTYTWPALTLQDGPKKDTMFNKSDFMDMMMLQNAQMHHMVMQQLMIQNLPGSRPNTVPFADPVAPVALMRPPQSIYHHHVGQQQPNYNMGPPMDYYQQGYGW